MKKISCNVIQDLIPLYIENICSVESNELVSNHIQECQECRMNLEEAEKSLFVKMDFPQKENIEKEEFEIFKKIIKKYQKQAMKKITASAIGIFVIFIVFFGARWYWCEPHISILYEEAIYDTFSKIGEQSGDEFFWWEGYAEKMIQTWEGETLVLEGKTSHAYRMEQEKESTPHTGWVRLTDSLERIVYRDANGDHVIWEKGSN